MKCQRPFSCCPEPAVRWMMKIIAQMSHRARHDDLNSRARKLTIMSAGITAGLGFRNIWRRRILAVKAQADPRFCERLLRNRAGKMQRVARQHDPDGFHVPASQGVGALDELIDRGVMVGILRMPAD